MMSEISISRPLGIANTSRMDSKAKTVSEQALMAEWQIVQAAQQDPARFRPLYDKYYESIFRFIYQRIGNDAGTADVCSQVFLKALQRLSKYQYRGVPFSSWLYRIASNEVAQYFRDHKKNRTICVDDQHIHDIIEEVHENSDDSHLHIMIRCLDELPLSDLQLIEMRYFEKRPFKEIAAILNITESNAKVKTYRILDKLKKRITTKPADFPKGIQANR